MNLRKNFDLLSFFDADITLKKALETKKLPYDFIKDNFSLMPILERMFEKIKKPQSRHLYFTKEFMSQFHSNQKFHELFEEMQEVDPCHVVFKGTINFVNDQDTKMTICINTVVPEKSEEMTSEICIFDTTNQTYVAYAYFSVEKNTITLSKYIKNIQSFDLDKDVIYDWYYKVNELLFYIYWIENQVKIIDEPPKKKNQNRKTLPNDQFKHFTVERIDASYYTTIFSIYDFAVKGHWRNQVCGKDRKERKQIWISDFKKQGVYKKRKRDT